VRTAHCYNNTTIKAKTNNTSENSVTYFMGWEQLNVTSIPQSRQRQIIRLKTLLLISWSENSSLLQQYHNQHKGKYQIWKQCYLCHGVRTAQCYSNTTIKTKANNWKHCYLFHGVRTAQCYSNTTINTKTIYKYFRDTVNYIKWWKSKRY